MFQVPTQCGHLLFSGPHFVRYTQKHTFSPNTILKLHFFFLVLIQACSLNTCGDFKVFFLLILCLFFPVCMADNWITHRGLHNGWLATLILAQGYVFVVNETLIFLHKSFSIHIIAQRHPVNWMVSCIRKVNSGFPLYWFSFLGQLNIGNCSVVSGVTAECFINTLNCSLAYTVMGKSSALVRLLKSCAI